MLDVLMAKLEELTLEPDEAVVRAHPSLGFLERGVYGVLAGQPVARIAQAHQKAACDVAPVLHGASCSRYRHGPIVAVAYSCVNETPGRRPSPAARCAYTAAARLLKPGGLPMNLPPGVTSHMTQTPRLRIHHIESGPADGVPVVMIHGNLATGRFFEHLFDGAPAGYRFIAPDMRAFGDTERKPMDATRGLRDWADDTHALLETLGVARAPHLVGWSTGGAAIANYAQDRHVASLTFIDPVSPYGFGGVKLDGTPCFPDYAGSGGGTGNPEFIKRIADHDTST